MIIENILAKHPARTFKRKRNSIATPGPVVGWVGGKRQLMSRYMEVFPSRVVNYFEPFAGGASVFFELKKRRVIEGKSYLSDLNSELIMTYSTIVKEPTKVAELLNKINEKHSKQLFYEVRNVDRVEISKRKYEKKADLKDILTDVEIAARFLYLNKTCFNALYRVNSQNLFNVPVGTSLKKDFSDKGLLLSSAKVLKTAKIENLSYEKNLHLAQKGDFVYFDPPYEPTESTNSTGEVVISGKNFTSYTSVGFDTKEQIKLKECCDNLNERGIQFAVSNSNAPIISEIYKNYNIREFEANRNLNRNAAARKNSATELLISNF